MIVIPKLKLNKFQKVNVPSGRELFKRFGVSLGISYSGDEVAPAPESKIDQIARASSMNDRELAKEAREAEKAARAASAAAAAAKAPAEPASAPADPTKTE